MTEFNRRSFLIGTAAAGAALSAASAGMAFADEAAAGAVDYVAALGDDLRGLPVRDMPWTLMEGIEAPIAFEEGAIPADKIVAEYSCDVLVIGGGISGIMAATKAAGDGASVICVEKMSTGRNQWESVGGWNSSSQQEKGIEVNPAVYVDAIVRAAGYRCRTENVWSFLRNSGAAIDFMQEVLDKSTSGIVIEATGVGDIQGEHTFLNTGAPTWLLGPYVMNALNEAVATYDNIDMRFNTSGVQLVFEGGRVTGAIVKDETGYAKVNAAKGVVLATGGYEMNAEMVKAWCRPEDVATTSMSALGTGSTGDGHMMGLQVGANIDPLPHCTMSFGGGFPGNGDFFNAFWWSGIAVNARGERFVNESIMFNFTASAINTNAYRGGVWTFFDSQIAAGMDEVIARYESEGWIDSADTVEELAEKIGVDPERLADTIAKWNGYFDAAEPYDAEYMRPLAGAVAFNQPPFYAVKTNSAFLVTVSGLIIDPEGRVLDKAETPIPGLYAAGNTSGGMFADQYPRHLPATSVGRAVTTGFVAGRTAAAE